MPESAIPRFKLDLNRRARRFSELRERAYREVAPPKRRGESARDKAASVYAGLGSKNSKHVGRQEHQMDDARQQVCSAGAVSDHGDHKP